MQRTLYSHTPALLTAHLDKLNGRWYVEEEEETEGQHGREDRVEVDVVDLVVVHVFAKGRRKDSKCRFCAGNDDKMNKNVNNVMYLGR